MAAANANQLPRFLEADGAVERLLVVGRQKQAESLLRLLQVLVGPALGTVGHDLRLGPQDMQAVGIFWNKRPDQ